MAKCLPHSREVSSVCKHMQYQRLEHSPGAKTCSCCARRPSHELSKALTRAALAARVRANMIAIDTPALCPERITISKADTDSALPRRNRLRPRSVPQHCLVRSDAPDTVFRFDQVPQTRRDTFVVPPWCGNLMFRLPIV